MCWLCDLKRERVDKINKILSREKVKNNSTLTKKLLHEKEKLREQLNVADKVHSI